MSSLLRLYAPDECGPDGYPPEWHVTIKHQVREDAGNRCVRCLHPYEAGAGEWSACDRRCTHRGPLRYTRNPKLDGWTYLDPENLIAGEITKHWQVEARWRVLTVHHLTGCWGREADAKADCRWWNLVAVCQRCHLTLQRKVDMHRVWPWE